MASEKISQLPAVSTPTLTDIFPEVQSNTTYSSTLQQILTLFQPKILLTNAGNPNSVIAGTTYQLLWDTTNSILWECTTTGSSSTAVWTAIGGSGNFLPLSGGTMTGNIAMGTNSITGLANPVNAQDAATKNYVDAIASGGGSPVVAATTANLNATYSNGVAGVGATLTNAGALAAFSIDGQSPTSGARVLVKNQSTNTQNGVYTVTTVGSGAVAWVLTRAADYDTPANINNTGVVPVENGTVNVNTGWINTTVMVTIGTTAITFVQFGISAPVSPANGGTGVNNGTSTITIGGNLTLSGAFTTTFTVTGNTSVTLPTSGTLVPTTGTGASGTWGISITGNAGTVTTNANLTGDVTSTGNSTTIASHAVTYAKMQQASTVTLLGNPTGSTANIQEITLGTNLSFSGSVLNATGGTSSPLTTKGDIWGWTTTNARFPVGSDGQVISADSSQSIGLSYQYPFLLWPNRISAAGDFLNGGTNSSSEFTYNVITQNGGGSISLASWSTYFTPPSDGSRWGFKIAGTGTNSNAECYFALNTAASEVSGISIGGGQLTFDSAIYIPTLSTSSQRFYVAHYLVGLLASGNNPSVGYGYFSQITGASGGNGIGGIWISYIDNQNSGQLVCGSMVNGTSTTINSSFSISANTWYRLRIIVDATAANIYYYAASGSNAFTLLATQSTAANIPTGYWFASPAIGILKTTGTTTSVVVLDYTRTDKIFTTQR